MKSLTDQELIAAYKDAVELQLEEEFIALLLLEIHARGVYQKHVKEQQVLTLSSTR